jgi:flagellar biosynthesis/type III secretory pathway M-ring protein FliF/YscJ
MRFFLTPISSPTVSQTGVTSSANSLDPAVLAALVGLAGVIIAAIITGMFAFYQLRRNAKLERQRQEEQYKHEQEMLRFQKELEEQYKRKEREQQHQETEAEAARSAMLRAQTLNERVAA